jgi:hypothetical protein
VLGERRHRARGERSLGNDSGYRELTARAGCAERRKAVIFMRRIERKDLGRLLFFFVLSIPLFWTPSAAAQQEKRNEKTKKGSEYVEPIITEETMPNDVGEWDFRFSGEYAKDSGNRRSGLLPRFQAFFGIVKNLGAEIDVPIAYRKQSSSSYGVGDVAVSFKWLVVEPGGRKPAIVLGLESGFPTGDTARQLGEGTYELTPFVALLKNFSRVTLQGNVGVSNRILTSVADPDEERRAFTYNWTAAFPFRNKSIHLLAEVNGEVGLNQGAQIVAFSPGFKYQFNDRMFLGIAIPVGLTRETKKIGVVVQFQVGIGKRE